MQSFPPRVSYAKFSAFLCKVSRFYILPESVMQKFCCIALSGSLFIGGYASLG
ncbi:hypothetical protein EIKCOROL_01425 [Eikenella corrodens ATCC 23834]|uniref:Uncharacterized protein n=1 Tax=Eikenella corrodens ATCC 23834 TaxID=546274 RepID=C0DVN6_EIKCO|nr:hypothetical protein EIKCOROL_01425 [Eikenella corrodens ATCC 23834]